MAKRKVNRCIVCGKKLDDQYAFYRVSKGKRIKGKWQEVQVYGDAHQSCFAKMVESPQVVIEELRRQVRDKDTKAA